MTLIKEESEEFKIEEVFSLKQEDAGEQTNMALIKEESGEMKMEETFSVKQEDTGWFHSQSLSSVMCHASLYLYLLHVTHDKINDMSQSG